MKKPFAIFLPLLLSTVLAVGCTKTPAEDDHDHDSHSEGQEHAEHDKHDEHRDGDEHESHGDHEDKPADKAATAEGAKK